MATYIGGYFPFAPVYRHRLLSSCIVIRAGSISPELGRLVLIETLQLGFNRLTGERMWGSPTIDGGIFRGASFEIGALSL